MYAKKKEFVVPSSTIDINYTEFVKPNTSVDDRVEPFTFEEDAFQLQYPWEFEFNNPVSYTHLTLPTICSV